MRNVFVATLVVGALVSCGPTKSKSTIDAGSGSAIDAAPLPHTLTAINVTPQETILELDLNASAQQAFVATGVYMDGVPEDLTAQVTWTSTNASLGTMSGPTLSILPFSTATAVTSKIKADLNGITGVGQITVAAYRKTGAQQDFFFILPYTDPAGNAVKPLAFSTKIPSLDVFFVVDTTGSMGPEIANLQSSLNSTVIPGIQAAANDTQFGVGALEDFPVSPYGNSNCPSNGVNDQPFKLLQTITSSTSAITAGVNALASGGTPIGCGNDWPEGGIEAIYQVATHEGLSGPAPTNIPATPVGFRAGSMPVIVAMSDANWHDPSATTNACASATTAYSGAVAAVAHSTAQTNAALLNACARVVGVAAQNQFFPGACSSQNDMEGFAKTTGARVPPAAWDVGTRPSGCAANQCCTGVNGAGRAPDSDNLCPVVFIANQDGTGVSAAIVTGIQMLARFAQFDVTTLINGLTTDIDGVALPTPHTTADFIKAVTPKSFVLPPAPPVVPNPTFDTTAFHGVTPNTKVSFDVTAFNDFVMQTQDAQIFRATIQVLAGGCTPLDQRDVLILVPPQPITIQ